SGVGLVNARVGIYNAAGALVKSTTRISNAGVYAVRGLVPGTYYARTIVSAATPYYRDEAYNNIACVPCTVTATTPIAVTANTITSNIDFDLEPAGAIAGVVTNASSSAAVGGVAVELYGPTGTLIKTTTTGLGGTYGLNGLPAGNYFA